MMLNKAQLDLRILIPVAAIVALTFLGAMVLTKLTLGIAFAAIVASSWG